MRSKILFIAVLVASLCLSGLVYDNSCSADDRSKLLQKMLKQLTKDKKAEKREEAAKTLGDMKAIEAVNALGSALQDPDTDVRWAAAYSLYEIAPDAKAAIPALKEALNDSSGHVRLNAVAALRKMDVPKPELVPSIRQLLKNPDAGMRVDAADSLLSLDVPIAEVLPVLLEGLKSGNAEARVQASETLADYTLPVEALPALTQALKDSNPKVRENSARAIGKIGLLAGSTVPALAEALKDSESNVRVASAIALAATGPSGKEAIPALVQAIKTDQDEAVRQYAVRALYGIDIDDPAVIPGLLQGLKDQDEDVRSETVDTFREMQWVPQPLIAALEELARKETNSTTKAHAETFVKDFKARDASQVLEVTPRPKIETLLRQLDKKLKDTDRKSISEVNTAMQYLTERNIPYRKGEFWSAVTQGYAETVDSFLRIGMSPNTLTTGGADRSTPLQSATLTCTSPGSAQISLILLIYGADPNLSDQVGRTPILAAAESCPPEVVEALLMSGAKMDAVTKGGSTVLAAAVMSGRAEIVRKLLKSGYKLKNEPAYLLQTAKAHPEIRRMLLQAGVK